LFPTELAQRLQEVIARAERRAFDVDHRLVHEIAQHVGDVHHFDHVVGTNRLGSVEIEATGENRQPVEQATMSLIEQLIRPVDRDAQRAMPVEAPPIGDPKEPEAVVDPT
jgi:hypothetical protein